MPQVAICWKICYDCRYAEIIYRDGIRVMVGKCRGSKNTNKCRAHLVTCMLQDRCGNCSSHDHGMCINNRDVSNILEGV